MGRAPDLGTDGRARTAADHGLRRSPTDRIPKRPDRDACRGCPWICAPPSTAAGEVSLVALGEGAQLGVGVEPGLEPAPRGLTLRRDVLARPVAFVRPVALQDVARHR